MPDATTSQTTVNLRPPLWLPVVAVVLGGLFYVGGKYVETRDNAPITITVTGEGKAFVEPDIAELSFGIQTGRMQTAKEAMTQLREGMDKVFVAVKDAGIEEKDIRTEQFSLNPIYDWTEKGQIFRGFEASQSLRVKVRDLDKTSDVLTAATDAGANQAGGVVFTVDDPEKTRRAARDEAIAEAREKAQKLAADLGMRLGKLKGFNEGGGPVYPMMRMEKAMAMDSIGGGTPPLPLPEGEQEITSNVTLTYELR